MQQLNYKELYLTSQKKKNRCLILTSPIKPEIRNRAVKGKECTKECDARAKLLFCQSKTLFTWSGGPWSSGVGFFCFVSSRARKQKKPTPLTNPTCKQALNQLLFCFLVPLSPSLLLNLFLPTRTMFLRLNSKTEGS